MISVILLDPESDTLIVCRFLDLGSTSRSSSSDVIGAFVDTGSCKFVLGLIEGRHQSPIYPYMCDNGSK
jgi:hypothetical protein